MPGIAKRPKRPRDPISLGKLIGDIATGQAQDEAANDGQDPAAVALDQRGGNARASKFSREKRSEIAKWAAASRWRK